MIFMMTDWCNCF